MAKSEKSEKSPLKKDDYDEPSPMSNFKQSYYELLKSPIDLWYLCFAITLSMTGLCILIVIDATYVTEILDLSDVEYAYYGFSNGVVCLVFAFILGGIPDRFEINISSILANINGAFLYLLLLLVDSVIVQILLLLFMKNITTSIIYPTAKLGIQRYTNHAARSLGFSLITVIFYGSQAIAGLIAGIVFSYKDDEDSESYAVLFWIAGSLMFFAFLVSTKLRILDFDMRGDEVIKKAEINESFWQGISIVFKYKSFWKLFGVCLLLSLNWSVNSHLIATLPLYMDRDIEDNSDYFYVTAVSYASYAVFTPTLTLLVHYYDTYTILLIGGFITSASPLILLLGAEISYVCIFALLLSIGGSIQYPRILEYALLVATKGREGYYFSLASLPILFSFMITGLSSGLLLNEYCPEDGDKDCWAVWLWISLISFLGSFLLLICRKWLEQPILEPSPFVFWSNEGRDHN